MVLASWHIRDSHRKYCRKIQQNCVNMFEAGNSEIQKISFFSFAITWKIKRKKGWK